MRDTAWPFFVLGGRKERGKVRDSALDIYRISIYNGYNDIRYILFLFTFHFSLPGGEGVARKKLETLTEQMYYVLLALARESRHGYEIMQVVGQLTGGRVVLGAGTLYALLSRFEEEGYIFLCDTRERRKYYALSPSGRAALREEYARLRRQVADGEKILREGDSL